MFLSQILAEHWGKISVYFVFPELLSYCLSVYAVLSLNCHLLQVIQPILQICFFCDMFCDVFVTTWIDWVCQQHCNSHYLQPCLFIVFWRSHMSDISYAFNFAWFQPSQYPGSTNNCLNLWGICPINH